MSLPPSLPYFRGKRAEVVLLRPSKHPDVTKVIKISWGHEVWYYLTYASQPVLCSPPLIKWQYVIIMAQDFPRKWRGISSYSLQAELCGLFCIHVVVKCLLVIERPLSRLTRIRRCVVLIPESWSLLLGPRRNTLTQRQPSVVCQHFGCSIAPPKLCQLQ